MSTFIKVLIVSVSVIVLLLIVGLVYVSTALPNVGPAPENLKVEASPEKIERGKYLANHVMLCIDCHSKRDFSLFSAPPIPGTEAIGGERFDHSMGFPGVFVSPNITPAGIGDYTDGELFRLITTGVKKDGNPIFPVMPYASYGKMDPEDIEAVIAYIRSLESNPSENPVSEADFPVNLIMRTMPVKAELTKRPPAEDAVAYGKYLTTASACADCHTQFENGAYTGEPLAGGRSFLFPDGSILTSANLTPHETGLKNWSRAQFIERFKMFELPENIGKLNPGEMQTIMPWAMYAGMSREDLGAIYDYLQSLEPVENTVTKFIASENS
ncbi:c-type cytochrome [Cyclobacterium sp.]|uniref:c-type cytochrome n=1 Tax=Cyclobacterium sp. TaxID=1966343 RepID=UPI00199CB04C|nr:c-type cytochrome [Cyclobacterium sp.]MBD3629003.1 c-type cytochrome [Cyclobacterium sp.]